jgi:hypothetical protein
MDLLRSGPRICLYCGKPVEGERGCQSATKRHVDCAYQQRLLDYSDKRTTEERRQYFRDRRRRRQQAAQDALNSPLIE